MLTDTLRGWERLIGDMTSRPLDNLYEQARRASMIDVLRRLGVEDACKLSPSRGGKIHSPLRDDDTDPSFHIISAHDKWRFKDYGTGAHGDVIDLVTQVRHCSSSEAARWILKVPAATGQNCVAQPARQSTPTSIWR